MHFEVFVGALLLVGIAQARDYYASAPFHGDSEFVFQPQRRYDHSPSKWSDNDNDLRGIDASESVGSDDDSGTRQLDEPCRIVGSPCRNRYSVCTAADDDDDNGESVEKNAIYGPDDSDEYLPSESAADDGQLVAAASYGKVKYKKVRSKTFHSKKVFQDAKNLHKSKSSKSHKSKKTKSAALLKIHKHIHLIHKHHIHKHLHKKHTTFFHKHHHHHDRTEVITHIHRKHIPIIYKHVHKKFRKKFSKSSSRSKSFGKKKIVHKAIHASPKYGKGQGYGYSGGYGSHSMQVPAYLPPPELMTYEPDAQQSAVDRQIEMEAPETLKDEPRPVVRRRIVRHKAEWTRPVEYVVPDGYGICRCRPSFVQSENGDRCVCPDGTNQFDGHCG